MTLKLNATLAAFALSIALVLAACYPVAHGEGCNERHEDSIQVGEQWFCFDDGDGYPTTYPGIDTPTYEYPTAGGTT